MYKNKLILKYFIIIIVLLLACKGGNDITFDNKVNPQKISYNERRKCLYNSYKNLLKKDKNDQYFYIPIYNGKSSNIRLADLYKYSIKNNYRATSFCLNYEKSYFEDLLSVINFYRSQTFQNINLKNFWVNNYGEDYYRLDFHIQSDKLKPSHNWEKTASLTLSFIIYQKGLANKVKNGYLLPGMQEPNNFEDLKRLDKEFYKVDVFKYEINGL